MRLKSAPYQLKVGISYIHEGVREVRISPWDPYTLELMEVRVNGEDNNLLKRASKLGFKTMTSAWTSEDFFNSNQQIDDEWINEEARM